MPRVSCGHMLVRADAFNRDRPSLSGTIAAHSVHVEAVGSALQPTAMVGFAGTISAPNRADLIKRSLSHKYLISFDFQLLMV